MITRSQVKKYHRMTNRDLTSIILCDTCQLTDSIASKIFFDNANNEYICEKCLNKEKDEIDHLRQYMMMEEKNDY
jgi:hypothetical protein